MVVSSAKKEIVICTDKCSTDTVLFEVIKQAAELAKYDLGISDTFSIKVVDSQTFDPARLTRDQFLVGDEVCAQVLSVFDGQLSAPALLYLAEAPYNDGLHDAVKAKHADVEVFNKETDTKRLLTSIRLLLNGQLHTK